MSASQLPKSTPSGRLMIIANVPVKLGKEQIVYDLIKATQQRANSEEEPGTLTFRIARRVDKEGNYLPVFVAIEEYKNMQAHREHRTSPPLQTLVKALKESGILDGEITADFVDG
ncbi:hypothetical protein EV368DRAFT_69228 [Lentinula lateritia]|nr:hypothetical protein EV368DRAFT_69228 [Lentinula lateritia]